MLNKLMFFYEIHEDDDKFNLSQRLKVDFLTLQQDAIAAWNLHEWKMTR